MTDDLYERYKESLRVGHVAVLRGSLEAAVEAYRSAAEIAPSRALPHTSLGGVMLRLGHLDEALVEYATAVARAPYDEGALLGQAEALAAAGKRSEAAVALDQVAEIQAESGRLPEAADTLRRAMELAQLPRRAARQQDLMTQIRRSAGDHAAEQLLARALRLRDETMKPVEAFVAHPAAVDVPLTASVEAPETAVEPVEAVEPPAVEPVEVVEPVEAVEAPAVEPLSSEEAAPVLEAAAEEQPDEQVQETLAPETELEAATEGRPTEEEAEAEHGEAVRPVAEAWDTWWRTDEVEPRAASADVSEPLEAQAIETEPTGLGPVEVEAAEIEAAEIEAPQAVEEAALAEQTPEPAAIEAAVPEEAPAPAADERVLEAEAADWDVLEPAAVESTEPAAAQPVAAEPAEPAERTASEPEPVPVMAAEESEKSPLGDELLAAAEAAESAEDAVRLRSMLLAAARAYEREGRFEAALDAAQRLLRSDPSDVETHLVLAELYMARDWNALAIEKLVLLERLARLSGDDETRQRVCVMASRAYPGDERLGAACA